MASEIIVVAVDRLRERDCGEGCGRSNVAKKVLRQHNIEITGYISQIGAVKIDTIITSIITKLIKECTSFARTLIRIQEVEDYLTKIRKEGDSSWR